MTDRAPAHTENASEQFVLPNRTLILVHTVSGATFEMEQKPIWIILDLIFVPSPCEKVVIVPNTNCITSAIRKFMMEILSPSCFQYISLKN